MSNTDKSIVRRRLADSTGEAELAATMFKTRTGKEWSEASGETRRSYLIAAAKIITDEQVQRAKEAMAKVEEAAVLAYRNQHCPSPSDIRAFREGWAAAMRSTQRNKAGLQ